jgi:hypothetical protein
MPQLLEQPITTIDYGEAYSKTNQNYDWTSEKKFLHFTITQPGSTAHGLLWSSLSWTQHPYIPF